MRRGQYDNWQRPSPEPSDGDSQWEVASPSPTELPWAVAASAPTPTYETDRRPQHGQWAQPAGGFSGPPPLPPTAPPRKSRAPWIAVGVIVLLLIGGGIFWTITDQGTSADSTTAGSADAAANTSSSAGPGNPADSGGSASGAAPAVSTYALADLTVPTHVGDFFLKDSFHLVPGAKPDPPPEISADANVVVDYRTPFSFDVQILVTFAPGAKIGDTYNPDAAAYGDLTCGTLPGGADLLCEYPLSDGVVRVQVPEPPTGEIDDSIPTDTYELAALSQSYVDYATTKEADIQAADLSTTSSTAIVLPEKVGAASKVTPSTDTPAGVVTHAAYEVALNTSYDVLLYPGANATAAIDSLESAQLNYGITCGTIPQTTRTACVMPLADGALLTTDGAMGYKRPDLLAQFTFLAVWAITHPS